MDGERDREEVGKERKKEINRKGLNKGVEGKKGERKDRSISQVNEFEMRHS